MAEDFHFNMVQLASVSSVVLSLALNYLIHQLTGRINYKSTRRIKKNHFFSVAADLSLLYEIGQPLISFQSLADL
jgi:hypothetical protein